MATIPCKIEQLLLDQENPRITTSQSQHDVLQKILTDQDIKLAVLAESISRDGLNPMDRWLVMQSPDDAKKRIVLEGNRRLAALRILRNVSVLDGLEVRGPVKKVFKELAEQFDIKRIEPIDCFEVADRDEANPWLSQRHTGENEGSGIVNWGGVATARFRGKDPALQALDLVLKHGNLSPEEKGAVERNFPITTLERLISTPMVRDLIGVQVAASKLRTDLPADEVIKPLRRLVIDLATRQTNVSKLKTKDMMVNYVKSLSKDLPDLKKRGKSSRNIDEMPDTEFSTKQRPIRRARAQLQRKTLIPRTCTLNIPIAKIGEIATELRKLQVDGSKHSISVMLRVFIELSVDHYLTTIAKIPTEVVIKGHSKDKSLNTKVQEAIKHMVSVDAKRQKDFDGVIKGVNNPDSPLYMQTLHNYVHNRFFSPAEKDLTAAWDNSQPFFEHIWK